MATFVVTAQHLTINSVDLTSYVRSASLELSGDSVDFTAMASSGAREFRLGLKSGTLNVELNGDFANSASAVDQAIWSIWNTGTNVTFTIRPVSSAVSTSNPNYSGSLCPTNFPAVGGAVGDASTVSLSWPTSGAITRATV
jgi:hypothetical protein